MFFFLQFCSRKTYLSWHTITNIITIMRNVANMNIIIMSIITSMKAA